MASRGPSYENRARGDFVPSIDTGTFLGHLDEFLVRVELVNFPGRVSAIDLDPAGLHQPLANC